MGKLSVTLLCLSAAACVDVAPAVPRSDVTGCYRITLSGSGDVRAPEPPAGLRLTGRAFLAEDADTQDVEFHRFDARAAREAFFVYPDTALRVAWWWEPGDNRRLGVGNRNLAAAFYIEGVVLGDAFEGEMHRWRYDDQGRPTQGPGSWSAPVQGSREGCTAP